MTRSFVLRRAYGARPARALSPYPCANTSRPNRRCHKIAIFQWNVGRVCARCSFPADVSVEQAQLRRGYGRADYTPR